MFIAKLVLCLVALKTVLAIGADPKHVELDLETIDSCPGVVNKLVDLTKLEPTMLPNGTISMEGIIELYQDIETGPWPVSATIYRDQGMKYVELVSFSVDDMCQELAEEDKPWSTIVSGLTPVPPKECPINKDRFIARDLQYDLGLKINKQMEGRYRLHILMEIPNMPSPALCYDMRFTLLVD